jgi:hypothetical protein
MSASTLPIPELPRIGATVQISNIEEPSFLACCHRYGDIHNATCPTRIDTPSKRIGLIAWRWNRQYPGYVAYRAKYEMAASDREIELGFELGQQMSEEYSRLRCWYGDPAYGSWPESAKSEQPVKQLMLALMRGEAELIGERPMRKPAAAEANREEEAA